MIIAGIVLLLIAWLLPYIVPVPPGIEYVVTVLGWIALVVGIILWLLSLTGRPVGGRRYWY
jgi:hypothetical protein